MTHTWHLASSHDVSGVGAYADAIGSSAAWQGVLASAARVAMTEATVFLQGESGTGKEVIARLIHRSSPRRHGPFAAINCAALPEQLLEPELSRTQLYRRLKRYGLEGPAAAMALA